MKERREGNDRAIHVWRQILDPPQIQFSLLNVCRPAYSSNYSGLHNVQYNASPRTKNDSFLFVVGSIQAYLTSAQQLRWPRNAAQFEVLLSKARMRLASKCGQLHASVHRMHIRVNKSKNFPAPKLRSPFQIKLNPHYKIQASPSVSRVSAPHASQHMLQFIHNSKTHACL